MRVGEEAEGVEHDHEQSRQGECDEGAPIARPANRECQDPHDDPDDEARVPARELIQAKRNLCIRVSMRKGCEQRVPLADDPVEARLVGRMAKDEVMVRRRGPHVADAAVRPRDPDALTCRDRFSLRRFRKGAPSNRDLAWLPWRRVARRRPEVRLAELLPDRLQHA